MSLEGDKVLLFGLPGINEYGESVLNQATSLNQISRDLIESTNTTVIREAEPGIPAVVRNTSLTDEYGGRELINISRSEDKIGLWLSNESELDTQNKKTLMEAKEIEFRQDRNIEELKRIGIFIHTMKAKNKNAEKKMREIEHEFSSLINSVDSIRAKLRLPDVGVRSL